MRQTTSYRSSPARLGLLPGLVLVLLGALIALGTLAAAWAPALGDGRHEACTSRGVPYSPPYESWRVEVAESQLPIGVTCMWTDPDTGNVVEQEPSWAPTVAAGTAAAFGCCWLAVVGRARVTGSTRSVRCPVRRNGRGRASP